MSLARNASRQHIVEGGDAIGGDEEKAFVIELIDVPYFAAGVQCEVREVCLQEDGIEDLGSHERILHAKIVAYSIALDFFVNRHKVSCNACCIWNKCKVVDSFRAEMKAAMDRVFAAFRLWKN